MRAAYGAVCVAARWRKVQKLARLLFEEERNLNPAPIATMGPNTRKTVTSKQLLSVLTFAAWRRTRPLTLLIPQGRPCQ